MSSGRPCVDQLAAYKLLMSSSVSRVQVLERMGVGGVRVLAHTQATLSQDALQSVSSLAASQTLMGAAG